MTGVFGLVVNKAHILLIKRGTEPFWGYWALPGGVVEEGEGLEAACIREVKEETGIDVRVLAEVGRIGDTKQDNPVLLCLNMAGQLNCSPPESLAVYWAPIEKRYPIKLVPFIKEFLEGFFTFGGGK